jgi:uncharacterized protein with FMN-binding domain
MRHKVTALLSATAIALPAANAWATAEATPKKKVVTTTKKFTGPAVEADRWGPLQVAVMIKTTTTTAGAKKTVTRRITAVTAPVYPDHTDRSVYINQQALPILFQEVLKAQSASVDLVSRATDTSDAFVQSLQGALAAAKVPTSGSTTTA